MGLEESRWDDAVSAESSSSAVRLVRDRGVSIAQASRDLDVHENMLRSGLGRALSPLRRIRRAEDWELVAITGNNIAYLKRPIGRLARAASESSRDSTRSTNLANTQERRCSRGCRQVPRSDHQRDLVGAWSHGQLAEETARSRRRHREVSRLAREPFPWWRPAAKEGPTGRPSGLP
jgi:transposase